MTAERTMKALTIRQPWAQVVVEGVKPIENRAAATAKWKHRGWLAIHASAGWSKRGAEHPLVCDALAGACTLDDGRPFGGVRRIAAPKVDPLIGARWDHREYFHFGAVIGVVHVDDIHPDADCCQPWGEQEYTNADGSVTTQVTHLVLSEARQLAEPVPAVGRLGLWTWHLPEWLDLPEVLLGDGYEQL